MRLTKYQREAFVRAVLNDVPKIDYESAVRKLVSDDNIAHLPEKIKAVAIDPKTRDYLRSSYYHTSIFLGVRISVGTSIIEGSERNWKPSPAAAVKIQEMMKQWAEQQWRVTELEGKVSRAIWSVMTIKQAKATLPEFVKYLPEEPEKGKSPNLPAPIIANLLADLSRAGWPKGKQIVAPEKRGRGRPRKAMEVRA